MYRVHFDSRIGRFVIQVSVWFGLGWKTVLIAKNVDKEPTFDFEKHSFRTYKEASDYIDEIGLNKLYKDKSVCKYHEHMNQNVQPVQQNQMQYVR